MEYKKLKDEIKEIGAIAAAVPEAFREKCFEVLLSHLLSGQTVGIEQPPPPPPPDPIGNTPPKPESLTLQSNVKAFMRRRGVSQKQIEAIVMLEGDEFHFIKEPEHGQISKGQTEWALLIALKNGILNNCLKADPEEVRSIVQDKGFYDPANFASNFKTPKCSKLFKGLLERQGDAQAISTEGEAALASLIQALSGISS